MPSAQINQPSNQIKLTNVSMVRLKKGKKRFEIACYKNTVQSYRAGHETDLDNVLQIPNVFLNVSKGQVAPNDEIVKAFGKGVSRDEIIMEILQKGELQVGEKERAQELERVHREVVEIVAGRLVDPKTKRVYTTGMVEKALEQLQSQSGGGASAGRQAGSKGQQQQGEDRSQSRDQQSGTSTPSKQQQAAEGGADSGEKPAYKPKWTGVSTNKSAKSQALEAMKALIAHQPIPVARARMRLRITCPTSILKQSVKLAPKNDGDEPEKGSVKDKILSYVEQVESQDVMGEEWECVGFVEPGSFKTLGEFINTQTKGRAVAEVLDMAVTQEEK
jgi:ribosome maturation protein SDO1